MKKIIFEEIESRNEVHKKPSNGKVYAVISYYNKTYSRTMYDLLTYDKLRKEFIIVDDRTYEVNFVKLDVDFDSEFHNRKYYKEIGLEDFLLSIYVPKSYGEIFITEFDDVDVRNEFLESHNLALISDLKQIKLSYTDEEYSLGEENELYYKDFEYKPETFIIGYILNGIKYGVSVVPCSNCYVSILNDYRSVNFLWSTNFFVEGCKVDILKFRDEILRVSGIDVTEDQIELFQFDSWLELKQWLNKEEER